MRIENDEIPSRHETDATSRSPLAEELGALTKSAVDAALRAYQEQSVLPGIPRITIVNQVDRSSSSPSNLEKVPVAHPPEKRDLSPAQSGQRMLDRFKSAEDLNKYLYPNSGPVRAPAPKSHQ